MSITEIKELEKPLLNVADIAPLFGCSPQDIREQAKADRNLLGFDVCFVGRRIFIPRIPFLKWLGEDV